MKLKLVAAISALAIPGLAHAQQSGPQPKKPTKADVQNVVQIVTSDKVKTQAYCDLTKLEDRVKAVQPNTDPKTFETFTKQAEALMPRSTLQASIGSRGFHFQQGFRQLSTLLRVT